MIRFQLVTLIATAIILVTGCAQGAVVFEPTPLPPDRSPVTYQHPSGVFQIDVPREWAVFTETREDLVAAFFTPPDAARAVLQVAVIKPDATGTTSLLDMVNNYQSQVRLDASRYVELERQAIGDGSWRLIGLRRPPEGREEPVNTFIAQGDNYLSVVEIMVDGSETRIQELERAANTVQVIAPNILEPAPVARLGDVTAGSLRVASINAWTTAQGVLFVTGEIANLADRTMGGIPIRVALQRADGSIVTDALDRVMGYGVAPGDFAPFSLRYGEGRSPDVQGFTINLGNAGWNPEETTPEIIIGGESLTWQDSSSISVEGHLLIEGEVTNTGSAAVRDPMIIITVFDSQRRVIAAAFTQIDGALQPEETASYFLRIQEMGGIPEDTITAIQALPVAIEPTPEVAPDG